MSISSNIPDPGSQQIAHPVNPNATASAGETNETETGLTPEGRSTESTMAGGTDQQKGQGFDQDFSSSQPQLIGPKVSQGAGQKGRGRAGTTQLPGSSISVPKGVTVEELLAILEEESSPGSMVQLKKHLEKTANDPLLKGTHVPTGPVQSGEELLEDLSSNAQAIYENMLDTLPPKAKEMMQVAMKTEEGKEPTVEDLLSPEEMEDPELVEEAERKIAEFVGLDPAEQGEYRYQGSFMEVLGKALALAAQIKGLVSVMEGVDNKEKMLADKADMEDQMKQALREIEKRVEKRKEIREMKAEMNKMKEGPFSGVLGKLMMAAMIAAAIVAMAVMVLAMPVFAAPILLAAPVIIAVLTAEMFGASVVDNIMNPMMGMVGIDPNKYGWINHIIVGVVMLSYYNPGGMVYIMRAVDKKQDADNLKELEKMEEKQSKGIGRDGSLHSFVSRAMMNIALINRQLAQGEGIEEDKAAFLAAMTAMLAMLMTIIAAIQSGGAGAGKAPAGGQPAGQPGNVAGAHPTGAHVETADGSPSPLVGEEELPTPNAGFVIPGNPPILHDRTALKELPTQNPEELLTKMDQEIEKMQQFVAKTKEDPDSIPENGEQIMWEFVGAINAVGNAMTFTLTNGGTPNFNTQLIQAILNALSAFNPIYAEKDRQAEVVEMVTSFATSFRETQKSALDEYLATDHTDMDALLTTGSVA